VRVDLSAPVHCRDGSAVRRGHLVILRDHLEVTQFVIRPGALVSRDVTVTRATLLEAEDGGDALPLRLTRQDLQAAPRFDPFPYLAPARSRRRSAKDGFLRRVSRSRPEVGGAQDVPFAGDAFAIGADAPLLDRSEAPVGVVAGVCFDTQTGGDPRLAWRLGGLSARSAATDRPC
jgi:hypothetical protein